MRVTLDKSVCQVWSRDSAKESTKRHSLAHYQNASITDRAAYSEKSKNASNSRLKSSPFYSVFNSEWS